MLSSIVFSGSEEVICSRQGARFEHGTRLSPCVMGLKSQAALNQMAAALTFIGNNGKEEMVILKEEASLLLPGIHCFRANDDTLTLILYSPSSTMGATPSLDC